MTNHQARPAERQHRISSHQASSSAYTASPSQSLPSGQPAPRLGLLQCGHLVVTSSQDTQGRPTEGVASGAHGLAQGVGGTPLAVVSSGAMAQSSLWPGP